MPSNLERVADTLRDELLQGNKAALSKLAETHAKSWTAIKTDLDKLVRKIDDSRQAGIDITENWLFRQARYKSLMNQLETELTTLVADTTTIVDTQLRSAIELGQQHAQGIVMAAVKPATDLGYSISWTKLNKPAIEKLLGYLQPTSPLSQLLDRYGALQAQGIKDTLLSGITQGLNPRVLTRQITKQYGKTLDNLYSVVHTETMRTYRSSQLESYQANDNIIDSWIWHSALKYNSCSSCYSRHGQEFPLTDELQDHPNGLCSRIPKTKSWEELFPGIDMSKVPETQAVVPTGAEVFKTLPADKQRRILGSTKYKAYKDGRLDIADIATSSHSDDWGDTTRIKTLKELDLEK